jgi:sRNA-binding protein
LRVIAGRLTNGEDTYRDVDVSFAIEDRQVKLPVAKLTTENGLSIGLEGRVEQRDSGPFGTLAYDVVGATPEAMHDLVRKAGLLAIIGDDRFQGLKDGKIAGLIRLGIRSPAATDVTFDGTLNGAHLNGTAEFDGGLNGWRSRASRVQTILDAPSLPVLLATLGRSGGNPGQAAQPARASLITVGTIATGSESRAEISSQDLNVSFNGNARWPDDAKLALGGTLEIKAAQSTDTLALAGLSLPSGADDVAAHGTLEIGRDKGAWTVAARNFSFGTSTLAGNLTAAPDAGALRIEGNITADRVTVPGLLAAVTDARSDTPVPKTETKDNRAAADVRPVWPEGLFNFSALNNTNATLKVAFKSLELSGGLAAHDGKMTVTLAPGKLAVGDLSAVAAGGQLAGTVGLEKASNGVALTTALTLDQAKLSSVSAAGKGSATFDLRAEARAQSPAGLMAVITGSGTAKLTGAQVSGPSTATVAEVVDDVLSGQLQNDPKAIAASLVEALNTSTMTIGDRELPIALADGSIKLDKIVIEGPDGRIDGTATADLTTLGMDASFQLTSLVRPLSPPSVPLPNRAPPAAKPALPPAIVLYSGQLDNLAGMTVNADVADLQRELVVRQMERNVEELEQSRHVDEERVRLEKERKKKAAADRAAAIAAPRKKETEQLPPVIPESAGTAKTSPDDTWGADAFGPSAQQPAAQDAAKPADAMKPGDAAKPADGASGNTVLTPKISIEPIPPVGAATGEQNGANSPVVAIDPETGLPIPKPEPAVRPSTAQSTPAQRRPDHRRTSSDEVMKTLGGFQ